MLGQLCLAIRFSGMVVIRAISVVPIPPLVVCLSRYIEYTAHLNDRLFFSLHMPIPEQTHLFWVIHIHGEHCHLCRSPVSPSGVNCTNYVHLCLN